MSVVYVASVSSYNQIKEELKTLIESSLASFTNMGQIVDSGVTFENFRVKNMFNSSGADPEEYFYCTFGSNGSHLYLGTCRSIVSGAYVDKSTNADMATISGIVFPARLNVIVTSKRISVGVLDSSGVSKSVYLSQVNYSLLDLLEISTNATHLFNMQNNLHVYGSLGNTARLLYAGDMSGTQYNQPVYYSFLALSETDRLNSQNNKVTIGTVAVTSEVDEFYGVLDGVYLSKSSVFHTFDKAVDSTFNNYRVLKDSSSRFSILIKEED